MTRYYNYVPIGLVNEVMLLVLLRSITLHTMQ